MALGFAQRDKVLTAMIDWSSSLTHGECGVARGFSLVYDNDLWL
ncbi:hypothetical protein MES4922_290059 [Mesorhizobium ventifaucium]|uniref:Uncharacterized protein n=1 Tax=Mesorhizobium ventifaucium TaxID=666020 RepID=A0ABN8JUM3_9HYPH|nr:hypothetical protein MES4922_290059 [Mesorhizobium ventifaucium]